MSLLSFMLARQPTITEVQTGGAADVYGDAIAEISDRVSWWRFNETAGATIAVDAEGVQNGAYQGAVVFSQTPLPSDTDDPEIRLNGTDAYVEITHNAAYNLTSGTLAVWFQLDSVASNRTLLSKDIGGLASGNFLLWYVAASSVLRFQLESASTQNFADGTSFGALAINTPYCAIIQWGAGGMKLYLAAQGGQLQLIGSNAYTGSITNTNNLRVGASQFTGVPANFFDGVMGDVLIWNRALNDAELETVAQATLVSTPGTGAYEQLVAGLTPAIYLKLNETSGATVADSSGNGRPGTITGTPAGYNVTSLVTGTATGNGGLNLGNAAWISVPHATADTALTLPSSWSTTQSTDGFRFIAECTISIKFKLNSLPTAGNKAVIFARAGNTTPGAGATYCATTPILATQGSTQAGGTWEATVDDAGAVQVHMRSFRGRPAWVETPDGAVVAGTTYHLAVCLGYDGIAAWLNGAKFEDGYANLLHVYGLCANIRRVVFVNSFDWTIGRAGWGGQADIQVDEFAVFHRAPSTTLTQANINALAEVAATPEVLPHRIWGRRTVNRSSYASIQAAIDDLANDTPIAGGTVLINGGASAGTAATYNESVVMKTNVRLKKNPATAGYVQINGRCTCPVPSIAALTDDATNFLTGDRTLDITNTRAAGDIIKIMATAGNPSPMRHDRRWNSLTPVNESNDPEVPDGETFEIASRTASEITVIGVGSTYDFASANRQAVSAFTPVKWIALEGDLRFTSENTVEFGYCNYARVVGIRGTNTNATSQQAIWGNIHARNVQLRNCLSVQPGLTTGASENDGIAFWNGCVDCVVKDCACQDGRHGADAAGNLNSGPSLRIEFHNCTWTNNNSRTTGGRFSAFLAHGTATDCISWKCNSNYGGPSACGWAMDVRWMVCGDPNEAGSGALFIEDGALECVYRDLHIIRPNPWFAVFEGVTSVDKCHFESITRTANPTDTGVHENSYGTGALVNTYTNVDAALRHSSWQAA